MDPDELDYVMQEIDDIEDEWELRVARKEKMVYRGGKYVRHEDALFAPDYEEENRFRVLNTMRSVETTVRVKVKE